MLLAITVLASAGSASAQSPAAPQTRMASAEEVHKFRADYIAYLDSAQELTAQMGLAKSAALFAQAKKQFETLSFEQLQFLSGSFVGDSPFGDPSFNVQAKKMRSAAKKIEAKSLAAKEGAGVATASKGNDLAAPLSGGLPSAPFSDVCGGDAPMSTELYFGLLNGLNLARTIHAGFSRGCDQTVLGTNAALGCIVFDIALAAAEGAFEAAEFCFDDIDGALIEGSYSRLEHIHGNIESSVANDNANASNIVANDNSNRAQIVANDNANKSAIVANDNANTASIIANDNTNTAAIIANDNANFIALRSLLLRTQIEANLAEGQPVGLYLTPAAQGGQLDLVRTIVTETMARITAAGGSVGTAQSFLTQADAAKAAGQFKTAYDLYCKAYRMAVK